VKVTDTSQTSTLSKGKPTDDSKYAILGDKILRYAYGPCDVTADLDKSKDQLVNFCYTLHLSLSLTQMSVA
jgi:hypothetical protein